MIELAKYLLKENESRGLVEIKEIVSFLNNATVNIDQVNMILNAWTNKEAEINNEDKDLILNTIGELLEKVKHNEALLRDIKAVEMRGAL